MAKTPAKGPKAPAKSKADSTGASPAPSATIQSVQTAMPPPTVTKAAPEAPVKTSAPKSAPVKAASSVPDVKPQKPATPSEAKPAPKAQPQQQRSGFFPFVLGGLVAGVIGYGAAYLQNGEAGGEDSAAADLRLTDLETQLAAMEAQVANLPAAAAAGDAPTDVTATLDGLQSDIADLQAKLTQDVANLQGQIDALSLAAASDPEAQNAAVATLSAQIAAQQAELQQMTEAAEEQLAATRAEAEAIQQGAVETARNAIARSALARVQGALESGAPMGAALTELGSALPDPVPDALMAVSDGAPTLSDLQSSFGEYARAANAAARDAGEDGEDASALTSFLRSQLDVRSTTPREGTSVDATLSRAEAALRDGRLNDTLAEIATLPETARAALSEWTAQAEMRAAARDAADTLATSLNAN